MQHKSIEQLTILISFSCICTTLNQAHLTSRVLIVLSATCLCVCGSVIYYNV